MMQLPLIYHKYKYTKHEVNVNVLFYTNVYYCVVEIVYSQREMSYINSQLK